MVKSPLLENHFLGKLLGHACPASGQGVEPGKFIGLLPDLGFHCLIICVTWEAGTSLNFHTISGTCPCRLFPTPPLWVTEQNFAVLCFKAIIFLMLKAIWGNVCCHLLDVYLAFEHLCPFSCVSFLFLFLPRNACAHGLEETSSGREAVGWSQDRGLHAHHSPDCCKLFRPTGPWHPAHVTSLV